MTDLLKQVILALDELLPAMTADGGGAEFISLKDGVAILEFSGSCKFCPSQRLSASAFKSRMLERIPELRDVIIT
jgi:Fe-S cluster biogenesis protein NfuA